MRKSREWFPVDTLRNPLTGERQYDGTSWEHREIKAGIIEERVTFTARRWKLGDKGEVLRQDCNGRLDSPWVVEEVCVPLPIQLFLDRFARGQRIDGSTNP